MQIQREQAVLIGEMHWRVGAAVAQLEVSICSLDRFLDAPIDGHRPPRMPHAARNLLRNSQSRCVLARDEDVAQRLSRAAAAHVKARLVVANEF
jgi:hypothetical protein